ncbi:MAG: FAD-dependent oxidoreductase [Oscillospiraceae bacterium]|nr:FAD-dependent oxidoreductase [Oscillospiraceae bacterium]
MLNITINGKPCKASPNQTVLDACSQNGVNIPTLCHDPRLKPFGSCMICRVEIEGQRGVPLACSTQIADGMNITTESEEITASRRTCLELLVSQHYGDCTAPCTLGCPARVSVQEYVNLIAKGEFEAALRVIKAKNPLPVVCGRICTRPCEAKCRRNVLEGEIGIAYLKRFVADLDLAKETPYLPEKSAPSGKKAAIIGAGPAGLSAAWFLAQQGHDVTIFERQENPGGMLRYGIPAYRMPRERLDEEIAIIQALGVDIQYNVDFGKDITVQSLKADGYDSILLAVGSQKGWPLDIDGESDCRNILIGVEFLGAVTRNTQPDFTGKTIAVVGGGNTAMDCARTAVRLGAASVQLIYRRTVAEMPADQHEIHESQVEGVQFATLTNPVSVAQSHETVQLTLTKMELGEPDESGRRRPQAVIGSEHTVEFDYVISAIGQTQDLSFVNDDCNIALRRDLLVIDERTTMTNIDGIFAAGDAVTGPQTAILAIATGKRAAEAMHQYMCGVSATEIIASPPPLYNHIRAESNDDIDPAGLAHLPKVDKVEMPSLTATQRQHSFDEVELGLDEAQAKTEASRCLSCGCADVHECKLREYASDYDVAQYAMKGDMTLYPPDKSHEFIVRDRNKCIMCGRCVRICIEAGQGVLGFVGRGFDTTVEPSFSVPMGDEKNCNNCGLCVSTCPTGALVPQKGVTLPTTAYVDVEGEKATSIEDALKQVSNPI